jgi:hypothetical protein
MADELFTDGTHDQAIRHKLHRTHLRIADLQRSLPDERGPIRRWGSTVKRFAKRLIQRIT